MKRSKISETWRTFQNYPGVRTCEKKLEKSSKGVVYVSGFPEMITLKKGAPIEGERKVFLWSAS